MSGFMGPIYLADPGSTGNSPGSGNPSKHLNPAANKIAVLYVAEVAGTTATWKVQGTLDGDQTTDANANWFDVPYVLPSTDTLSQAAIVRTTLGADVIWLDQAAWRFFRRIRLVVTANTGQTYRAELHQQFTF